MWKRLTTELGQGQGRGLQMCIFPCLISHLLEARGLCFYPVPFFFSFISCFMSSKWRVQWSTLDIWYWLTRVPRKKNIKRVFFVVFAVRLHRRKAVQRKPPLSNSQYLRQSLAVQRQQLVVDRKNNKCLQQVSESLTSIAGELKLIRALYSAVNDIDIIPVSAPAPEQ